MMILTFIEKLQRATGKPDWLYRLVRRQLIKRPLLWIIVISELTLLLYFSVFPQQACAADKPPAIPDIQNYDSSEARQKSVSTLDAVSKAATSGAIPKIPNIKTPSSGVDIAKIAGQYQQQAIKPQDDSLLIFVSLSMPQEALVRLAKQAVRAQAVLVMRGVVGGLANGNWPRAMTAIKPMAATGASIMIHPEYFKQHKVTQVPTFVLTSGKQTKEACKVNECQQSLQAAGDVSLSYVLEYWSKENGMLAKEAKKRLVMLEGEK